MKPSASERVLKPGFNQRVYDLVRQVPAGFVTTYGDIARALGSPRVARHVGFALAALRDEGVPWHRVVNARGRLSLAADAAAEQRQRLEAEGIRFKANGEIHLAPVRWDFGELDSL